MIQDVSNFYVTGGTLGQDTPSYVARSADTELYEGLRRGEFCYVLTARQMGKSSLMVRTADRLREGGFTVATLDLTMVGQNLTIEQWYYGLLNLVGRQLGLRAPLRQFWLEHADLSPLQRFMTALREVILEHRGATEEHTSTAVAGLQDPSIARAEDSTGAPSTLPTPPSPLPAPPSFTPSSTNPPTHLSRPHSQPSRPPRLVLFIDEIDTVLSLPFSTGEFFAAIRECYNRRSEDPVLEGLTFCLLGVASPSDLIRDPRTTPFNIGLRIELQDFTLAEAGPLAVGLQLGSAGAPLRSPQVALRLLRRIHHWTGGHPYLTQRLCRAVAEDPTVRDRRGVDRACRRLFLEPGAQQRDDNLHFVQERLVAGDGDPAAYLELYSRIRAGRPIRCDEKDPRVPTLRLSGIIGVRRNLLRVRNRIYYTLFDQRWVQSHLPDAEVRRQLAAYRRGLLRSALLSSLVILALTSLSVGLLRQRDTARHASATYALQRGIQLLRDGDGTGLLNLLEAYRTAGGDSDLQRSIGNVWAEWEMDYRERLLEVLDTPVPSTSVAFSPDGHILVTGHARGGIRAWDTSSWTARTLQPCSGEVSHLAFSRDGKSLAAVGGSSVYLWKSLTGAPTLVDRPSDEVRRIEFTRGDRLLAIITQRDVRLFECRTGRQSPPLRGTAGEILQAAFDPSSQESIAIATRDRVLIYSRSTAAPRRLPIAPGETVTSLCFSPDGRRLALASPVAIRFWDTTTNTLKPLVIHSPEPIKGIQFDHRGHWLAGRGERAIRVWSMDTGDPFCPPMVHGAQIRTLHFNANDRTLLSVSGNAIRSWALPAGERITNIVATQTGLGSTAVNPAATLVAASPNAGSVQIWRPLAPTKPAVSIEGFNFLASMRYSRDGTRLYAGDRDRCRVWNTRDGRLTDSSLDIGDSGYRVAFSPDPKWIATTGNGALRIWSTTTGLLVGPPRPYSGSHSCLTFSTDGEWVALGTTTPGVQVWKASTARPVSGVLPTEAAPQWIAMSGDRRVLATAAGSVIEFHPLPAEAKRLPSWSFPKTIAYMAFLPGTQKLVVASGKSIVCRDLARKEDASAELTLPGSVRSATADTTGLRLAAATSGNLVQVYDLQSTSPVGPALRHDERVHASAFSPCGRRLATCEGERRVRLWDLITGEECGPPRMHQAAVLTLQFRPDGRQLAVQTETSVQLWDVPEADNSFEWMQLRTWVTAGARRTERGIEAIPAPEWRNLRDRLRKTQGRTGA